MRRVRIRMRSAPAATPMMRVSWAALGCGTPKLLVRVTFLSAIPPLLMATQE